jgi:hypothetical protein
MTRKVLASILALILLLTISPTVIPQTKPPQSTPAPTAQDWQQLTILKPGTEILIEFKGGLRDPFQANFSSAYDDELLVRVDELPIIFKQRDIQRVYSLKGKRSRSETAKIGAGIGMVAGTLIAVKIVADREAKSCGSRGGACLTPVFAGLFIGSLAGAGVGALLGGKRKDKLLYEAR